MANAVLEQEAKKIVQAARNRLDTVIREKGGNFPASKKLLDEREPMRNRLLITLRDMIRGRAPEMDVRFKAFYDGNKANLLVTLSKKSARKNDPLEAQARSLLAAVAGAMDKLLEEHYMKFPAPQPLFAGGHPLEKKLYAAIRKQVKSTGETGKVSFDTEEEEGGFFLTVWIEGEKDAGFDEEELERQLSEFEKTIFRTIHSQNTRESIPLRLEVPYLTADLLSGFSAESVDEYLDDLERRFRKAAGVDLHGSGIQGEASLEEHNGKLYFLGQLRPSGLLRAIGGIAGAMVQEDAHHALEEIKNAMSDKLFFKGKEGKGEIFDLPDRLNETLKTLSRTKRQVVENYFTANLESFLGMGKSGEIKGSVRLVNFGDRHKGVRYGVQINFSKIDFRIQAFGLVEHLKKKADRMNKPAPKEESDTTSIGTPKPRRRKIRGKPKAPEPAPKQPRLTPQEAEKLRLEELGKEVEAAFASADSIVTDLLGITDSRQKEEFLAEMGKELLDNEHARAVRFDQLASYADFQPENLKGCVESAMNDMLAEQLAQMAAQSIYKMISEDKEKMGLLGKVADDFVTEDLAKKRTLLEPVAAHLLELAASENPPPAVQQAIMGTNIGDTTYLPVLTDENGMPITDNLHVVKTRVQSAKKAKEKAIRQIKSKIEELSETITRHKQSLSLITMGREVKKLPFSQLLEVESEVLSHMCATDLAAIEGHLQKKQESTGKKIAQFSPNAPERRKMEKDVQKIANLLKKIQARKGKISDSALVQMEQAAKKAAQRAEGELENFHAMLMEKENTGLDAFDDHLSKMKKAAVRNLGKTEKRR